MFLFKELWHKYCNKNILCSDEYRDLFQPHGTVKHCISKIISGIFSTWSKSVRTFMDFPHPHLHPLATFASTGLFWFSLISSTVGLWSDSKLNSSYFFREIHHVMFRIPEELMMQKKSCKTSFLKEVLLLQASHSLASCTICSELELHYLFIFQIPPLT